MSNKQKPERKTVLRLLKLLSTCPKNACNYSVNETLALLEAGKRRIRIPLEVIKLCEGDGLVSNKCSGEGATENRRLELRREGAAHLKRALYPETPFQAQNLDLAEKQVRSGAETTTVLVNEAESPLLRLFTRKEKSGRTWLDDKQFRAGERLRADFEKAHLQPRVSANWVASVSSGSRGGSANDISDFAMDAKKRVERALSGIGPELSEVALDICCFLKGLETVERERGWPPRSAKLLLRTALSALARHYGLDTKRNEGTATAGIRTWSTPDYKPALRN